MRRFLRLLLSVISIPVITCSAVEYRPPAGERYATRGPNGTAILPGGRVIQPLGRQFPTGAGPFGMAVSASGKSLVTVNLGPDRSSVTVFRESKGSWSLEDHLTPKASPREPDIHSLFDGVAFANAKQVWISEGESGSVRLMDVETGTTRKTLSLNGAGSANSFAGDLAFDANRDLLYVVDQAHFRVVIFDTKKGLQVSSVSTGYLPYAISLSPGGKRAWVTNIGLFRYHALPGANPEHARDTGIPFPAYGFPSAEATNGTQVKNGAGASVAVPPLGDPNVRESSSVCAIDLSQPDKPKVVGFIRTGVPFGSQSAGGSGPSGVLATSDAVYVSNAHNDTIDVIDPERLSVRETIELRIPGLEKLRGIMPLGMALNESGNRLLVAEAGLNAIGVIDVTTYQLVGHLPVGWFPVAVAMRGNQVFVVNTKGRGTGPSTFAVLLDRANFVNVFRRGSVSIFPFPAADEIAKQTRIVLFANGLMANLDRPAPPLSIRHVVIIVKENRTFDEVLGDLSVPGAKVEGVPEMARFGTRGYARGGKSTFSLQHIDVTPNHHALARQFAFSDNFYADSDVSVDGHHWVVGAYPDAWTESSLLAAYAGQKSFKLDDTAPGRLLFAGSNSSVHPEEQQEAGSLWQHLENHGVSFRNFGEGFELAGNEEGEGEKPSGARLFTNMPMPDALFRNTSRDYPGFNMNIPDQYRAAQFISEIDRLYRNTGAPLPQLLFLHLPNDHTADARPADGYPYEASYVADNDVALGKIVDYLSHSPWWREMAIFITEDDAQSGKDHVDAHRTVFLGVSPYIRRNYVSHVNASFPAMLKTTFRLLGLPPLNLFDASAPDLLDMFTDRPGFQPYTGLMTDPRVFDPSIAREPLDPKPSIRMDQPRR